MNDIVVAVGSTKEGELLAYAGTRPACPFYGFMGTPFGFVDSKGNGCGLTGVHRPCAMEMADKKPDWNGCTRFNHEEGRQKIEKLLDCCRIFPDELSPPGTSKWEGVSLRGWYQLIMRE